MNDDILITIIPGKLSFVSLHCLPSSGRTTHYFSIDEELVYKPFFADFGPPNLAQVHLYIQILRNKLSDAESNGTHVVHVSSHDLHRQANAAFLVCAFLVIEHGSSAEEAFRPFAGRYPPLLPFRDASYGISTFDLTVLDCLEGLRKGLHFGWYKPNVFNPSEYTSWAQHENGGMSWMIPGKLLALVGPSSQQHARESSLRLTPKEYAPIFIEAGVRLVIRLNSKEYDADDFMRAGIRHVDMYFPDGSCPSVDIIEQFLNVVVSQPGPVAVHCRAGLGRTGVLVGLFALANYEITARAMIGWCRLARPGSLLGSQQQFLCDMEGQMLARRRSKSANLSLSNALNSLPSPARRSKGSKVKHDIGQGEWLAESMVSGPRERHPSAERIVQKRSNHWDLGSFVGMLTGSERN